MGCQTYDRVRAIGENSESVQIIHQVGEVSIGNNLGKNLVDAAIGSSQRAALPAGFTTLGQRALKVYLAAYPSKDITLNSGTRALNVEVKERVFYDYDKAYGTLTLRGQIDITYRDAGNKQLQWLPGFVKHSESKPFNGGNLADMRKLLPPESLLPRLADLFEERLAAMLKKKAS